MGRINFAAEGCVLQSSDALARSGQWEIADAPVNTIAGEYDNLRGTRYGTDTMPEPPFCQQVPC